MQSETLLQSLIEQTRINLNEAEKLKRLDTTVLTWKQDENSWSILECLEHLNRYGDYYLPQFEGKIQSSKTTAESEFRSGMLGNYFAKSMLPKENLNKMNTFKNMNPLHADLDPSVIDKFVNQQIKLLDLLNKAEKVNLNKVKVKPSVSLLPKLKLGDTFRFFINHNTRHLKQAERVEREAKGV